MAFDRPVDGIATATAPAALAADGRRPSRVPNSPPGTTFNHATRRHRLTPVERDGLRPNTPAHVLRRNHEDSHR